MNLGGSRESARPVGALQGLVKSHTGYDAGHNNRDQQKVALAGFERRAALPGPNATRALGIFRGVVGTGIENHAVCHGLGNDLRFTVNGNGQRTAGASYL